MAGRRLEFTLACAFLIVAAPGCSSERKLSHVDARAPAAAIARETLSPLRARITQLRSIPSSCPVEVRELLAPMALERVKYPPCNERLAAAFAAARPVLTLEESTAVEELLNGQCRVNPREGLPEALDGLLQESSLRRAVRGDEPLAASAAESAKLREALRAALLEMRATSAPLDQWVRNNGDFVFPEEQLEFFERIAGRDACRMPDQEVDLSYRTLHNLEELARIEAEGEPQRARIERFLNGVHKVIDRKIREFFR